MLVTTRTSQAIVFLLYNGNDSLLKSVDEKLLHKGFSADR